MRSAAAGYVPARRTSRIDPMEALRAAGEQAVVPGGVTPAELREYLARLVDELARLAHPELGRRQETGTVQVMEFRGNAWDRAPAAA